MAKKDRNENAGRTIAKIISGQPVGEQDKKDLKEFRERHAQVKERT